MDAAGNPAPEPAPQPGPEPAPDATAGLRAAVTAASARVAVWLNLAEARTAAIVAAAGFDVAVVDAQHGATAGGDLTGLLSAVHAAGVPVLVRVLANRYEEIGRALDAGADGVVVPMVETARAAADAVAAARYAPQGRRSLGPVRSVHAMAAPDPAATNTRTTVLVMVETARALEDVAEIAAVAGVDGVFVGPHDLSLSLGVPLEELLADGQALRRVVAACRNAGIATGAYAGSLERAARLRALGLDLLAVTTDDAVIAAGAADAARAARELPD